MKAIVLCAGKGSRLAPLTDEIPKCLVKVNEKPILEYVLDVFNHFNFSKKIALVGYRDDKINYPDLEKIRNDNFETTNMLATLFCSENEFNEELIISYGDIIYDKSVLEKLIATEGDIVVTVDDGWQSYWEKRFTNPLEDAESLKIKNGLISEVGQKTKSFEDIQSQYIGLLKVSLKGLDKFKSLYAKLEKHLSKEKFDNYYMTDFLQEIINSGFPVTPCHINRGWVEIDSPEDLAVAEVELTKLGV